VAAKCSVSIDKSTEDVMKEIISGLFFLLAATTSWAALVQSGNYGSYSQTCGFHVEVFDTNPHYADPKGNHRIILTAIDNPLLPWTYCEDRGDVQEYFSLEQSNKIFEFKWSERFRTFITSKAKIEILDDGNFLFKNKNTGEVTKFIKYYNY
jgi:hypothetical protein